MDLTTDLLVTPRLSILRSGLCVFLLDLRRCLRDAARFGPNSCERESALMWGGFGACYSRVFDYVLKSTTALFVSRPTVLGLSDIRPIHPNPPDPRPQVLGLIWADRLSTRVMCVVV